MVSLIVVFFMFVILFAVIGAMRGWAQEVLVTFSVVLAFFLIAVLEEFILDEVASGIIADGTLSQFWLRTLILLILVFFGYQTPRISKFSGSVRKEKISDSFLGVFLGGINGYLIAGTLWYYMYKAGYPFKYFINPEELVQYNIEMSPSVDMAINFVKNLPPEWLGSAPGIYIAVGLAFLFVLVVFI
jgi:lysylphosphatidylglycerol synthetase-like protein (DUF2156 family)